MGRWSSWAVAVVTAAAAWAPAGASAEPPRQTYSDRFTTDVPGASTGRTYAIDYFDPDDPAGKPHAFSRLRVELAEGARFDTSAIPQCEASDAELVAAGPSACPPETRVGTDETVVDTGFPGPGRYFTVDFVFFNNEDELILLATVRENGARVVVRGRIAGNTLEIDNPMVPGTPPDGAAAKSQRGQFEPRSALRDGTQVNYLTTPPTCPRHGFWVNRVTYTYRDGVEQTVADLSPCVGAGDADRPAIRLGGVPARCAPRTFKVDVRVADRSPLRRAVVFVDGRRVRTTKRKLFTQRIRLRGRRGARHRVTVKAVDAAGNRTRRSVRLRRC